MQHKIITLEMRLLVKDIVDGACLRATELADDRIGEGRGNLSSLKVRNTA